MAESKPTWTEECPEQKLLNQLFESRKIDDASLPNKIRQKTPAFMRFPARTFAGHFRKTKARYGAYAKNTPDEPNDLEIPELTGFSSNESKIKQKIAGGTDDFSDVGKDDHDITFNNPPHLTWSYTDHQEKVDIVCVAVPVISGSQDVDFGLSEDGLQLIIKYTWSMALYTPELLYCKKIATMHMSHPQIHSLASHLIERGFSSKSKPRGNIIVPLPVKVQREVGTWSYEGMKINATDVILFQFKAFQKKLIIDDADTSVTFA